ncbi:MAG: Ig-like domain-containing protein, partial [Mycobacterium sp.]
MPAAVVTLGVVVGAGRFVGRVGGLAVALGVGAAVSLGHGTAWADDTATTGSETSGSTGPSESTGAPVKNPETSTDTPAAEPAAADKPAESGAKTSHKRKPGTAKVAKPEAPKSSVTSRPARHAKADDKTPEPTKSVESAPVSVSAQAAPPVAQVAPAAPVVADSVTVASAAVVDSSLLGGVPTGPLVNSPLLWVAAAASRREFDADAKPTALATAAVNNQNPTLGTPSVGAPNTTGIVMGSIKGADADKDPLTYSAPATSSKGGAVVVNATTGAFKYTPTLAIRHAASVTGATTADKTDTFTITVSDGFGGTADKLVTVSVKSINTAPTAGTATVNTPDGSGVVSGNIVASDGDSDDLTFKAAPKKGTVTFAEDGSFTYTPTAVARHAAAVPGAASSATTETFTVTVTDGHGGTVTKSVKVAIAPANVDPVIGEVTAGAPSIKGVVAGQISVTDADLDKFTYSGTSTVNGKVVVNATTGAYTFTPTSAARHTAANGGATSETITLSVKDGHGGTASTSVVVQILPANANPTATVYVGTPNSTTGIVTGKVKGADADKDTLTYSSPTNTSKGSVTLDTATGAFTYTPTDVARHAAAGTVTADKTDSFLVTITDGHGGVSTKTVTVSVKPINTVLTAAATPTVNAPNGAGVVTGSLGVADADADVLTFKAAPKKGTVAFA